MKKTSFVLTPEIVQRVITTVDAGLSSGLGEAKPGQMCVEAAVCYALGLPHGDDPQCVDSIIRSIKIGLNDSRWSGKTARADGLRRLAVLQLGTKDNFDNKVFIKKVVLMFITTVLPITLNSVGMKTHAAACAAVTTLKEGAKASSDAASDAASYAASDAGYAASDAARYAASGDNDAVSNAARYVRYAASYAASDAARSAGYAASAASDAGYTASAASDNILKTYATGIENILIEMEVPAVKYLELLG